MGQVKTSIDCETLLQWAYRDELSKRQTSAAEGIWDRIQDYQNHGGIDSGRGAAQRYSHFGLPDPDALLIEKAVSALEEVVIDWDLSFYAIAGDLAGLISINDLKGRKPPAPPSFGWGEAGTKALKAFFGPEGQRPFHDRPRDVILVGGLKTNVLVTSHAIKGTRPDWRDETPQPGMTPAAKGTHAAIVGECRGKNLYSSGSYCPLAWSPSPLSVVTGRVDYAVWHQGLCLLAETLTLDKFIALPPKASAMPWIDDTEKRSRVVPVVHTGDNDVAAWGKLPLKPNRDRTAPPRRVAKAGPVRYPMACTGGA